MIFFSYIYKHVVKLVFRNSKYNLITNETIYYGLIAENYLYKKWYFRNVREILVNQLYNNIFFSFKHPYN